MKPYGYGGRIWAEHEIYNKQIKRYASCQCQLCFSSDNGCKSLRQGWVTFLSPSSYFLCSERAFLSTASFGNHCPICDAGRAAWSKHPPLPGTRHPAQVSELSLGSSCRSIWNTLGCPDVTAFLKTWTTFYRFLAYKSNVYKHLEGNNS